MDNYPALTIKQPFAALVARGIKDVENRSWSTDYRGPIFIHAGRAWDETPLPVPMWVPDREIFTYGAIIGTVNLIDVIRNSDSPWADQGFHHWLIKDAELFEAPVPARGKLGLWYPARDLTTGA
jgi:hypothetical protein